MRKIALGAVLFLPACTHTTVDVGNGNGNGNGNPPADASAEAAPRTGRFGDGGLTDADPRFTGNESTCPASPPQENSVCLVREWQSCAYWWNENGQGNYVGCTCFEKNSSTTMWDCASLGGAIYGCPHVQPVPGTPCASDGTALCWFPPHVSCGCQLNDPGATWRCEDRGTVPGQATAGPADVPENKRVKDLTEAEAQIWCQWLLTIQGPRASPPEGPISADGYATNLGYASNPHFYGNACMPGIFPISYCVANLKLAPCEATIAEMNDCALTMARDLPSPHGCGRLTERAYCEDTVFHSFHDATDAAVSCDSLKVR